MESLGVIQRTEEEDVTVSVSQSMSRVKDWSRTNRCQMERNSVWLAQSPRRFWTMSPREATGEEFPIHACEQDIDHA